MTTAKVKDDLLVSCAAYLAGLLALLVWPNRQSADQNLVLLAAVGIAAFVGMAVDWRTFHWRPDLIGLLTLTGSKRRLRPMRYSIPNVLGIFTALTLAQWLRSTGANDWGLTSYVFAMPVLLGGVAASNLWWALASTSGSAGIPRH